MCCNILRSITVEPVLLLFMFASSLTFSAFMAITYDKSCLLLHNASFCDDMNNATFAKNHKEEEDDVQSESSHWIMRSNIAMTVPAIISLLVWMGSWGDSVGRRLPLVVPVVASMFYSACNLLNAHYMQGSPVYLMIGPVFSGLGGSYLAILMASYTYITCLVDTDKRMMRVGIAESAVFLSSTISVFVSGRLVDTLGYVPVFGIALGCQIGVSYCTISVFVSGRLVDTLGYVPVFGIALGCQGLALAYSLFVLPDLKGNSERSAGCCSGVILKPARDMWQFLTTARAPRVRLHLTLLILVLNVLQLCTTGENDILLLYLRRSPRSWSYSMYGYFKGSENFTRGAAVLLLLPVLKKIFELKDTSLILAGLVSKIGGLVMLGLAGETWLIFLVVGVACLQGFPSAGLRAMMANLVHKNEQGRLFGLVASTESVTTFASTLLFNGLYPATLDFYDGFCFQMAAVLVLLCVCVIVFQHVDFTRGQMKDIDTSKEKEGPESSGTNKQDPSINSSNEAPSNNHM